MSCTVLGLGNEYKKKNMDLMVKGGFFFGGDYGEHKTFNESGSFSFLMENHRAVLGFMKTLSKTMGLRGGGDFPPPPQLYFL